MRLTLCAPFAADRQAQVRVQPGQTLGALCRAHTGSITACQVNGQFVTDWQVVRLADEDRVTLFLSTEEGVIIAAVITAIISTAISLGLSFIQQALMDKPGTAQPEQSYGIAGLTNTTAQGTPKIVVYGEQRVYGHILSTRVDVLDDNTGNARFMKFAILYFMGEGPIEDIFGIEINDTSITQFPGVISEVRFGGAENATLPLGDDFATLCQTWADGRQLPTPGNGGLVYQTRSVRTQRVTLILQVPFARTDDGNGIAQTFSLEYAPVGTETYTMADSNISWGAFSLGPLFKSFLLALPGAGQWLIRLALLTTENSGGTTPTLVNVLEEQYRPNDQTIYPSGSSLPLSTPVVYAGVGNTITSIVSYFHVVLTAADTSATLVIRIEAARVSDGVYDVYDTVSASLSYSQGATQTITQNTTLPESTQWNIRYTVIMNTISGGTQPTIHAVAENGGYYPNSALLAISGIASNQITSFESMRASGIVRGRKVKVWDGVSFTTEYTNKRAWILRDMLTDPRVGMGQRIAESFFDDDAALAVQNYWDGIAYGAISRDTCTVLLNDRRPAWDWMKVVLSEGRASLIPSEGVFKLVVDKADTAGLLYSLPGNIIEGTLKHTNGPREGPAPNLIQMQFPDAEDGYRPHLIEVQADGTETEARIEAPALTCYTLTRYEHAYWLARYQLLRQRLVTRQEQWLAPMGGLVSEPMDHVALAYDTVDFARGVSGFLSSDSSQIRIVLGRMVTLEAATSYTLMVRHQATNAIESRTVSTGAGNWGAVTVSSAFTTTNVSGDIWALGVTDVDLLHLVIQGVNQDADGWQLTATRYEASVHTYPAPPESPFTSVGLFLDAPALSGEFLSDGTMNLSWTTPSIVSGDTLTQYVIEYASFGDQPFATFYATGDTTTSYSQVFTELPLGSFRVRGDFTLQGLGTPSNAVQASWPLIVGGPGNEPTESEGGDGGDGSDGVDGGGGTGSGGDAGF